MAHASAPPPLLLPHRSCPTPPAAPPRCPTLRQGRTTKMCRVGPSMTPLPDRQPASSPLTCLPASLPPSSNCRSWPFCQRQPAQAAAAALPPSITDARPARTALTPPALAAATAAAAAAAADPAVIVSFPLDGDEDGASLVAWTTTPWTLPSNLALCVNAEFDYVKARDPGGWVGWAPVGLGPPAAGLPRLQLPRCGQPEAAALPLPPTRHALPRARRLFPPPQPRARCML